MTEYGTVVPQKPWEYSIGSSLSEPTSLQLTIFFINRNGSIGFRLSDTLEGYVRDLRNANDPALGLDSTTLIRICVSPSPTY